MRLAALFLFINLAIFLPEAAIKIMPLGDSITRGSTTRVPEQYVCTDSTCSGYRLPLCTLLTKAKVDFQFVGSEIDGMKYFSQTHHAGFPGISSSGLLGLLQKCSWENPLDTPCSGKYLDAFNPDIILLHIGTNGLTESISNVELILKEIDEYEIRKNKKVTVIVAKIINQVPSNTTVPKYNANIETLVSNRKKNGDNLILVDMEKGAGLIYKIDLQAVSGDMLNSLHPNKAGYAKMSKVWYNALMGTVNVEKQPNHLRTYKKNCDRSLKTCYYSLTGKLLSAKILSSRVSGSLVFVQEDFKTQLLLQK